MKNIIYIFPFLCYFLSSAQAYKPLLDNYNEWHFTTCYFGCLTDTYYTNGDTIVNNKNYKILDGYHYISRTFLLREEVSEKKVFIKILNLPNPNEYLLYDFSLGVGDSIEMHNPISPFPDEGGYYQIDAIELMPLVDGNNYRHFYLSPTPSNTVSTEKAVWIEGVGSLSIINAPGGYPDINDVGHLSCFFKNGEPFYVNLDSIAGCEPTILGVNEFVSMENVTISKPRKNDIATINNASSIKIIDAFDISGKRVFSKRNNGSNTFELNFFGMKDGIYLVVAYDKKFNKKTFKVLVD